MNCWGHFFCVSFLVGLLSADVPVHCRADDVPWKDSKPSLPSPPGQRLAGPRELLEMLGIDESYLRTLVDRRPLHEEEHEVLFHLLYHMRRFPLDDVQRWRRNDVTWQQLAARPEQYRAEIFQLRGRARYVQRVDLPAEAAERFQYKHYYRIDFVLEESGLPAVIYARTIPRAWQGEEQINQRASLDGLFLKFGEQFLFAADRIAWHPDGADKQLGVHADHLLLGELGMDVGLFDQVVQKRRLLGADRECFYQLLAAVERADHAELIQRGRRNSRFAPLLENPVAQQGRLVTLSGTARRAVKIPVTDRDIRERFGLDHYYEVYVFVRLQYDVRIVGEGEEEAGSRINPYPVVFCVRQLSEGMAAGDDIHEEVRVSGFFLKLWAYRSPPSPSTRGKGVLHIAPLLVGYQPEPVQQDTSINPYTGILMGGLFIAALAGIWYGLWRASRNDKRQRRISLAARREKE